MTDFNTNLSVVFLCDEALASDVLVEELVPTTIAIGNADPDVKAGKLDGARFVRNTKYFIGGGAIPALDLHDGQDSYTVSFWFNLSATSGLRYALHRTTGGAGFREWFVQYNGHTDDKMRWNTYDSGFLSSVSTPSAASSAGVWYMFVGGYDKANDVVFASLNGESRAEVSTVGKTPTVSAIPPPLWIGSRDASTNSFDGDIDHIMMWKGRALTDAEIAEYYNLGAGTAYPFPAAIGGAPPSWHHFWKPFNRG